MRRALAALAIIVVAAACSSDTGAPTSIAPVASREASVKGPKFITGKTKYKDSGIKAAKGQVGSVTIEARAVLGPAGQTVFEVVTGSFDDASHPGTIIRVKIDPLDTLFAPTMYNGLSSPGVWTDSLPGFDPGDEIDVDVRVLPDGSKKHVDVTVRVTVGRRPDVAVTALNAPAEAERGVPVLITAVLSELNGDMGARADCVLSVDGTDVSTIPDIWVDAGGTVSCLFSHALTDLGPHTVTVTAARVRPTDWGTSNNSASVTVAANESLSSGQLGVEQRHRYIETYYLKNGFSTEGRVRDTEDHTGNLTFIGSDSVPPSFPMQSADVEVTVDGVVKRAAHVIPNEQSVSPTLSCNWFASDVDFTALCSGRISWQLQYQTWQGSVTWVEHHVACVLILCTPETVTYGVEQPDNGNRLDILGGSVVRLKAKFVDGAGIGYTLDRSVTADVHPFVENFNACHFEIDIPAFLIGIFFLDEVCEGRRSHGEDYYGFMSW